MGRSSELHRQAREDECFEWIRGELGDIDADEYSSEWAELESLWHDKKEEEEERLYEEERNSIDWYVSHSYSEIHEVYQFKLQKLKMLINTTEINVDNEDMFYKMSYAHAVTIMEAFLNDTVRSLILSSKEYFENAISNIDLLCTEKYTIKELYNKKDGLEGVVLKNLSDVMYHNIPKVIKILENILKSGKLNINISEVVKITIKRHHIVHRDGKTKSGELIVIDRGALFLAMSKMSDFVKKVAGAVSK